MNKNIAYIGLAIGVAAIIYLLSLDEVSIWGVKCRIIGTQTVSSGFGPISEPVCLSNGVYFTGIAIAALLALFSAAFVLKEIFFSTSAAVRAPTFAETQRTHEPQFVAINNPAWKTLKEFDADIKGAVAQLSGLGREAEERLASAYLAVNDKSMLPTVVATIIEESRKKVELNEKFIRELTLEREKRALKNPDW